MKGVVTEAEGVEVVELAEVQVVVTLMVKMRLVQSLVVKMGTMIPPHTGHSFVDRKWSYKPHLPHMRN